jgi:hypothetical protein
MDLELTAWQGVDWIYKVQDIDNSQASVNMVTKRRVP